jgi:hypothetical protein
MTFEICRSGTSPETVNSATKSMFGKSALFFFTTDAILMSCKVAPSELRPLERHHLNFTRGGDAMSKNSINSRPSRKTVKPSKPYRDFPLSPHPSGAWCKKDQWQTPLFRQVGRVVNGHLTRIDGDGWKEALEIYQANETTFTLAELLGQNGRVDRGRAV